MRQAVLILLGFGQSTGHEHPHTRVAIENYMVLLDASGLSADEIDRTVRMTLEPSAVLEPMTPQVDRLLGRALPVEEVLATLDRQYRAEGRNAVYFLRPDQPVTVHLDELLGPSTLVVPLDEPVVPHLDRLLGGTQK